MEDITLDIINLFIFGILIAAALIFVLFVTLGVIEKRRQ